jgi:HK97 family phage portal protein
MGKFLGSRQVRQAFAEPPIYVNGVGAPRGSSGAVEELTAPAVWQCVNMVANAVASMPLETFRRTSGLPLKLDKSPQVVATPGGDCTQSEWLQTLVVSLLLRGNAYARIVSRDSDMRPNQLELLNPDRVVPFTNSKGRKAYRIGGLETDGESIFHVRGMTFPGSVVGLSPIAYAAATIGLDISTRDFARNFADGEGIPKAILSVSGTVDQTKARTVKERFLEASRNREPVVMGDAVSYQAIQIAPEESQFLATQQMSIAHIARFFGIPPRKVGGTDGSSLTYANLTQENMDFLQEGVNPWLIRVQDAFSALLPEPEFVKFNTTSLTRMDPQGEVERMNYMIAGGYVVQSEARTYFGYPAFTPEQLAEKASSPFELTASGKPKLKHAALGAAGPTDPAAAA